MKQSVLARPNLKLFLLGAMLVIVVQGLVGGNSPDKASGGVITRSQVASWTSDIDELLQEANAHPSSSVYTRISHYYERQRDYKKAISYLQKAERMARVEEQMP
ncbi:MAG TPA: hypothetical protein VNO52_03015 [Methylomirabilota bacterium]|nr:hypothetical protein [Methylomirabilota bacterium]